MLSLKLIYGRKGDHRKRGREVKAKCTQGESLVVATPSIIAIPLYIITSDQLVLIWGFFNKSRWF